ncbi:autotransporter domain-containing protein [Escherichia coli]|nr:autotransporter domain-containing protein [Escherichia coli]MDT1278619.1 autotransporter domain-containing protein [Escherichia coli]MDW7102670.1 autotransporter domain-containing protein [Escherichia coli]
MQRKKLLSVCVAMALSSQTWAADTSIAETSDESRKSSKISCPANIKSLSKEQLEKLPAECKSVEDNELLPWAAVGLAAAVTGVAVYALHDNNNHHDDPSPVPDDGGDTPVPPDDGGDTPVPPDDGGDTPVPPDDGGDTPVPPDDGGDTPVPPDDGGDTPVPPDDGGDTPVPPDDGGDTPDDGGDDTPDDGGDDTPVKHDPVVYKNDVTWDQDAKTLKLRDTTFTYAKNDDGSYTLTGPGGTTTIVKDWLVDEAANTASFNGVNPGGTSTWRYDEAGKIEIIIESLTTADGTTGEHFHINDATITDHGGNIALNGGVVINVDGNDITLNNDGKTTAIGEGSVVGILTGDDITITNNGETEVDGGTAVIVNGDRTTLNVAGDSTFTNGGTGSLINGDDAKVDNKGTMNVDGENSTGSKINGNDALVKQEGDLFVSGGAKGIDVTGNSTIISNKGNITVVDEKSIGILLDGNDSAFINMGDISVSDGSASENAIGVLIEGDGSTLINVGDVSAQNAATAIKIVGDNSSIALAGLVETGGFSTGLEITGDNNTLTMSTYALNVIGEQSAGVIVSGDNNNLEITGSMVVDGDSVGTLVTGNGGKVSQKGDLFVSDAGRGIDISGDRVTLGNTGKITVEDANSVGIIIEGDDAVFKSTGEINVSLDGQGAAISGDREDVSLSGDINVTQQRDSNGVFVGGTGVDMSGDDSHISLDGNINLVSLMGDSPTISGDSLTGLSVGGDNNTVDLSGNININVGSGYLNDQAVLVGVDVTGENNTINLEGGINITGDSGGHSIKGVSVTGNNVMNISGHSQMNSRQVRGAFTLVSVADGGHAIFDENSVTDFDVRARDTNWYLDDALITATGIGSEIENHGIINTTDAQDLMMARAGAEIKNTGTINVKPGTEAYARAGVMRAIDEGSRAVNGAGGIINLVSTTVPTGSSGSYEFPVVWYHGTNFALLASNYGDVTNESGATINIHGPGVYGVAASRGTATNAGVINVDGFIPSVDENGVITDEAYWDFNAYFLMAGGALAGSTDAGHGDADIVNTGIINVKNQGFGMLAMEGGTVINQGEINLLSDEGLTQQHEGQLFAMGAIRSGTAINDVTGVINIDTDIGQAFYGDGTGTIVNYGTICSFGICQSPEQYNPTDSYVSVQYTGGDILVAEGESTNFINPVLITDATPGSTINAGTVSGSNINVQSGTLENTSTGIINTLVKLAPDAVIDNAGSMGNIDAQGGTLNNEGTINGNVTMYAGASTNLVNNSGTISNVVQKSGVFNNSGTVSKRIIQTSGIFNNLQDGKVDNGSALTGDAWVNNEGTWRLGSSSGGNNAGMLEVNNNAVFNNSGEFILDNNKNAVHINQSGTLYNTGHMDISNSSHNGAVNMWGGNGRFINDGTIDVSAKSLVVSASNAGDQNAFFWNQDNGVINFDHDSASAVKLTHSNFIAQNDGTMNISGTGAVAMEGDKNAQLVNNGTINLGTEGTTDTGMIGMQLDANATADAVIENNGTINIFANDSFAFSVLGTEGHVVNNGTVVIADGVTGSGLIKQGDSINVEGVNGNNGNNTEVHYGDYTLPDVPSPNTVSVTPGSDATDGGMNNLNGYVVGTSADGSAGKLKVNNASMNGVGINTGFTAGTADTTVSFDNVVEGSNLTDADAITSTTVVWNAKGSTDANGNVDVTMSKNAYTDVATDASVNDVAKALDAGYTNNELYTSLNVGTTAELNSALKQVSGSQATTVFREARVLSNRFSMLADAAPKVGNGLAFNVVAKGDPRAELGNNTEYDMLALRKTIDLSESQTMSLEYGIARLDGDGAQKAGDNGVTGGYSQFFGLKHQMSFDNGMNWNNALRYDVHNLDSSRSIAFSNTNKTADTDVKQQYLEFRSEGAKTFEPSEGLKVTPYAGVKLRHTLEGGYQERNAGDFNLNMNSGSETAVDSIVGLKLDYAGKDGWSASATLEGGPNLSYAKSQRTASLAGAGSQHFNVDDGQKGGGINSLASVGVKYSSKESSLNLDAYHWKEDGISDKGVMLNFKKTF